jgi:hypothetical protein
MMSMLAVALRAVACGGNGTLVTSIFGDDDAASAASNPLQLREATHNPSEATEI